MLMSRPQAESKLEVLYEALDRRLWYRHQDRESIVDAQVEAHLAEQLAASLCWKHHDHPRGSGPMSRGTVQIVGAGGTAPWAPEPPAQESVEGRSFLVNATDIARVVAEARTELVDLAVPDGFSPLSLGAITNIVHTLQMHRIRAPRSRCRCCSGPTQGTSGVRRR